VDGPATRQSERTTVTFNPGQTIRIHRTTLQAPLSAEDSLARFERYGPAGMVYATREDGSDAVAFPSECSGSNAIIHVAKRSPEPVGAAAGAATATGFNFTSRRVHPKHKDGHTYAELAEMSRVSVNIIKKDVIAGRLKVKRLGHRTTLVEFDEAQRWMKSRTP